MLPLMDTAGHLVEIRFPKELDHSTPAQINALAVRFGLERVGPAGEDHYPGFLNGRRHTFSNDSLTATPAPECRRYHLPRAARLGLTVDPWTLYNSYKTHFSITSTSFSIASRYSMNKRPRLYDCTTVLLIHHTISRDIADLDSLGLIVLILDDMIIWW